jgi:mRNA-degrading endonuclease toxin of MazEF toxin-antitoxin module
VPKSMLVEYITTLPAERMLEVCRAVRLAFNR